MSGSAFAVTHHAFSSGAGRTSDGNGSHWSTSKTPSYTKSVSWQHHRVGVRILDSQSGEVTLGTPVVITFNNTNSYQELNFKARMESPSKDATPGNVYAQADYKIAYE
ncbi:fimbrial protein [Escherichia coli]